MQSRNALYLINYICFRMVQP